MSINLQKGQKIDLTKNNASLNKITVGLGWDPVKKGGGFFGSLLGGSNNSSIDIDASVIMLDTNNKFTEKENVVYFGNLKHPSGSVEHQGDNLTGDGDGDDEQINVILNKVPNQIGKMVFVVNIYDCKKRNQHFGLIQNAFIRIIDSASSKELCKFNLSDDYSGKTAVVVGEVYRHNNEWKFAAIGEGTAHSNLGEMVEMYL